MLNLNYNISGQLVNKANVPLSNFRIEAWDKDLLFDDFVGESIIDSDGRFEISFTEARYKELFFDTKPDLYFKIYHEDRMIHSTEESVLWNTHDPDTIVQIVLDYPLTPTQPNNRQYHVTGKVINSFGLAVKEITVQAMIKTIGQEMCAGSTKTDKDGNYSMNYEVAKSAPDLQILAFYSEEEQNTTRSEVVYNARQKETLNLTVTVSQPFRTTEYETLLEEVKQHLGDLKWNEIKEDDVTQNITYLSRKTGWDARLIAMLVLAHQFSEQSDIAAPHLYVLFRSNVKGSWEAINQIGAHSIEQALKSAIDQGIVPENENIQHTMRILDQQSTAFLLRHKPSVGLSTIEELMNIRLDNNQKNVFTQVYKQAGNDSTQLWSGLEKHGFTKELISKLKLDGKLGFLTGYNAPLISRLNERFNFQEDLELVHHGLYKASEWNQIIGAEIPSGITAEAYALQMASFIRWSYPTAVASEMINRNEINLGHNVPREEVAQFFKTNQTASKIGNQPIKEWIGYSELSTEAKEGAKRFERLYQISPSDEALILLADKGFQSATQIASYSKNEFLETYGKDFPSLHEATLTYLKSSEVQSMVLNIFTIQQTNSSAPNVYALSGKLDKTGLDMEQLFGNLDYCSCDDCNSVLSPAAYLVELLQFIDTPNTEESPLKTLFKRRPDIAHIQLSCENTNMALPYIDLVNEILEHYILNGDLENLKGHDIGEGTKQNELLAEPQFVQKEAYNRLKEKVFPYNLPFYQPLEILRHLFKAWDVSLADALRIFSSSLSAKKEILGFSDEEYQAITDDKYHSFPAYFGLDASETIESVNAAIANGKSFCRAVGISYDELAELLKTNFIRSNSLLGPIVLDSNSSNGNLVNCDFSLVTLRHVLDDKISELTELDYHKFHRFLRLRRKTGWSILTLDRLLTIFFPALSDTIKFDDAFAIAFSCLSNFKKLATSLALPEEKYFELLLIFDSTQSSSLRQEQCARIIKSSVPELLSLMAKGNLDPFNYKYEVALPDIMELLNIYQALKEQSVALADIAYLFYDEDATGKITPTKEVLLKDIKQIRDALSAVTKENADIPDNVDFEFAKEKMLQVYEVDITDTFFDLLYKNPTAIELNNSLPPELVKIYDSVKTEQSLSAKAPRLIKEIVPQLNSKLKTIALQQTLSGLLKTDAETINALVNKKEVLNSSNILSDDQPQSILYDFTQLEKQIVFNENSTNCYIDMPLNDSYLFFVIAPQGAASGVTTIVSLKVDGQVIIDNQKIEGTNKEVSNKTVVTLSSGLKSLELNLSSLPLGGQVQIWWRAKGIPKTLIPDTALYKKENLDIAMTSLIRLSKAIQLQNLFKLTPLELEYFAAANDETKGLLQISKIPGNDKEAVWKRIIILLEFNKIKKNKEPEKNTWIALLKDPALKNKQGMFLLEILNQWKEEDLTQVLTTLKIQRSDLSKISDLKKVITAMDLIRMIGFPAATSTKWITNTPNHEMIIAIKTAIKAKVTEATWLETMQTVSDPVRDSLRNALVSYILQYKRPLPETDTPNKLYEYFLVDVEMSACMKTSRIRLALSTIQLFIQRCLMSLEADVPTETIKGEQWSWMKRYRVWEANRKVFLYPENWLEPELRDNKSSLFKELEGELLQGEITDESAEQAYLNYLKKLDDIARLEVVGMYLEEDEQGNQLNDILHVIGRTNGNTRQYYYRRYEDGKWTVWEKVSLNIEGDHLFPIVWKKQLFLFWLNIMEKPAPVDSGKAIVKMGGEDNWADNVKTKVEINMSWGEYYQGKWISPKSTDSKRPLEFISELPFNKKNVQVHGKIEKIKNPHGKDRERIVFSIEYRFEPKGEPKIDPNFVWYTGGYIFSSKNAAPDSERDIGDYFIPLFQLKQFNSKIFNMPTVYSPVDMPNYTTLTMEGRGFSTKIEQPLKGESTITENILTKKYSLSDGFSILPLRHPIINQFEAPMIYADENSSFFVRAEEDFFEPLPDISQFLPPIISMDPLNVIEVHYKPEYYKKPTKRIYKQDEIITNPNYKQYINDEVDFLFGSIMIGPNGITKDYERREV